MEPSLDSTLEQWIHRFRGPLTGLLASWGSDWGAAEELAMDTFAEAWLSRKRFRGHKGDSRAVGAWLRGIAANLHRSRQRKVRRLRQQSLDAPGEVAAPLGDPAIESDERLDALRRAFAKLRPEHQTVLRMFYLDEASTREVAALLMLSPKAVEGRLYQARRALREQATRIHAQAVGGAR